MRDHFLPNLILIKGAENHIIFCHRRSNIFHAKYLRRQRLILHFSEQDTDTPREWGEFQLLTAASLLLSPLLFFVVWQGSLLWTVDRPHLNMTNRGWAIKLARQLRVGGKGYKMRDWAEIWPKSYWNLRFQYNNNNNDSSLFLKWLHKCHTNTYGWFKHSKGPLREYFRVFF